jgi:hypothetical protein
METEESMILSLSFALIVVIKERGAYLSFFGIHPLDQGDQGRMIIYQ